MGRPGVGRCPVIQVSSRLDSWTVRIRSFVNLRGICPGAVVEIGSSGVGQTGWHGPEPVRWKADQADVPRRQEPSRAMANPARRPTGKGRVLTGATLVRGQSAGFQMMA